MSTHFNAGKQMMLQETSLVLWRALAGAGPRGIGECNLLVRVSGHFDKQTLNKRLYSLQTTGYARRSGLPGAGVWCATDKVPLGEQAPAWQGAEETADAAADAAHHGSKTAVEPGPMAVSSVFTVGDRMLPSNWGKGLSALHSGLYEKTAGAQAEPLRMGGNWRPAATVIDDPAPAVTPQPAAPPSAPSPGAASIGAASIGKPALEPIFELHSDGMLVLDLQDGEPEGMVVLPPRVTRKLFRWLDRLGGTSLQRLAPEAAS